MKSPSEVRQAVTEEIVTKAAVDMVEKVRPFGEYKTAQDIPTQVQTVNISSPIAALTNINNPKLAKIIKGEEARKMLVENAQVLALAMENERAVNFAIASSLFDKNPDVATALYGPEKISRYEISEDQSDQNQEGVDIDLKEIVDRGSDIRDFWSKLASDRASATEAYQATKTFLPTYTPSVNTAVVTQTSSLATKALPVTGSIAGFKTGVLAQQWLVQGAPQLIGSQVAGWLTSGGPQQIVASSSVFSSRLAFQTASGKFGVAIATGKDVYGANVLIGGIKFGASKISVAVSATATKVGLSGLFARIGAFLGSAGPIIGTAIVAAVGWVVGKVAEKIPWKKVLPVLAALILWPFTGIAMGAAAGVGTYMLINGAPRAAIGAGIIRFFGTLGRSLAITIGTPILVTILVLPVVVALMLFIINSGAYIVPPSASTLANLGKVISPYIDVKKSANPAGPFTNSDLAITVEYTVEITAKKSPLTNVTIDEKCSVRKKSGSVSCPQPEPSLPDTKDLTISPGESYSFTYSMTFTSPQFEDSRVSNSIIVSADTPEQESAKAAGSASIKIGNPPEDCPSDWPVYPEDEPYLVVLQGPHTRGGTHDVIEAIDIFSPDEPLNLAILGNQVKATHQGTVTVGSGGNYGRYVDITSACQKPGGDEVEVTSRYAHLSAVAVTTGQTAGKDQVIGLAGSSGTPWPHVHYEFRPPPGPIPMDPPYLPRSIPDGCFNAGGKPCGVTY